MNNIKKLLLILVAVVSLVSCDLSTKHLAQNELRGKPLKSYLSGTFQFIYLENSGGMLSFADDLPEHFRILIFQLFVSIALILLLLYIWRKKDLLKVETFAFVLVLGGGFGNLVNRVFNSGNVIDFMMIEIFGFRTGVFNVADVYVTIGVTILVIINLLPEKSSPPEDLPAS